MGRQTGRFLRELPVEHLRKYGIFKSGDLITAQDIQSITRDQALLIYRCEFWEAAPFEKITEQQIANYVFDCAVQHGTAQGIKILQRALWAVHGKRDFVSDDGILGHATLGFIDLWRMSLVVALPAERAGFVRLVCAEQRKDKEFLDGWLNRVYRI